MGAGANAPPNRDNCTKLLYLATQTSDKGMGVSHVAARVAKKKTKACGSLH